MAATDMALEILHGVNRRIDHMRFMTDPPKEQQECNTFFLDVIDGLRHGASLRNYLVHAVKLLLKDLFDNQLKDCNLSGQLFIMTVNSAIQSCEAVQKNVWEATSKRVPAELRAEFDKAVEEFENAVRGLYDLQRDFNSRWPWVDKEKLAASIAAEQQGIRRFPAKEVFDELRRRVR